jgi:hypothetical protein
MIKCPDPKEIIWHHLKHSKGRKINIIKGWTLSIIFLLLILIVFYFLSQYKASLIAQA